MSQQNTQSNPSNKPSDHNVNEIKTENKKTDDYKNRPDDKKEQAVRDAHKGGAQTK